MPIKNYALWGSSGHAKVLAGVIRRLGGTVVATFDRNPAASALPGIPLYIGEVGFRRWVEEYGDVHEVRALAAIGGSNGFDRIEVLDRLSASGLKAEPVIDPHATVDDTAEIGGGSQVLPAAIISADAVLGRGCIVNHKASVDHECRIGSGVHIAPGATLCGLISVGDAAFIGTNATVLPRLEIGRGATIGAGAVVTRDVPEYAVVAGNPARVVRVVPPTQ